MAKYTYTGEKLLIEDAKFMYRPNFSGKGDKYNRDGDRKFTVKIEDPKLVERMKDDGWNVKIKIIDSEDPIYYIEVRVKFSGYKDPKCYFVTSRRRPTLLSEETVCEVDSADIIKSDMTITAYNWNVSGKTGMSAYLKTAYFTIEEDEWADQYANEEYPCDD